MTDIKTFKTLTTRPRYRFCWWCSLRLRANFHRLMQSSEQPAAAPVIVHADCADDMVAEGWLDVTNNEQRAA
jgi:hypothetical protein